MYVTSATLIFVSQLFLALAIGGYLAIVAFRTRRAHTAWLAATYITLSLISAAFAAVHSVHPALRLTIVPVQAPLGALMLLPLIRFAYSFPQSFRSLLIEQRIVLTFGALAFLGETAFAVFRTVKLAQGEVLFRPLQADLVMLAVAVTVPMAMLRQRAALNLWRGTRPAATLRGYFRPLDREARALTSMTICFGTMVIISAASFLFGAVGLPAGLPAALVALISSISVFTAIVFYVNVLPEPTSLLVKLLGLSLATLTAALAVLAGLSGANRPMTLNVNLPQQQTFSFAPISDESYLVENSSYRPVRVQSQLLSLTTDDARGCSAPIPFTFIFFGTTYRHLSICHDGTIAFPSGLPHDNYQFRYGAGTPLIMALLADLDPSAPTTTISYHLSDRQLDVAWNDIGLLNAPSKRFSFQATLYADGRFRLSYADLPETLTFGPSSRPTASLHVIGAVPGRTAGPLPTAFDFDAAPQIVSGAGFVRDYMVDYRAGLHERLKGGVFVSVMIALVIVFVFPVLFRNSLVRPMQDLLRGVERLEQGEYDLTIRPYASDELGTLARAFNSLAARLRRLISTLEERVAARTADLDAANRRLRAEILERLEAEQTAIEHQRVSAALQERERLARDLHDSLGQTLGSISIQVGTALALLDHGDLAGARAVWEQVGRSAARGHSDVRNVIRQLRTGLADGFWPALSEIVSEARLAGTTAIDLHFNEAWSEQWLTPIGNMNLLRIIQEALNNVLRHAGAETVLISLLRKGDNLELEVRDDGRGFDLEAVARATAGGADRLGLITMRERAEELDGVLKIDSIPGEGTIISVIIPIEPPHEPALPQLDSQVSRAAAALQSSSAATLL